MKRVCIICGCERETSSARSQYVCNATPCRNKTRRPRVPMHGLCTPKRKALFGLWKRRAKRARAVKQAQLTNMG